jgi:hypothetical protein
MTKASAALVAFLVIYFVTLSIARRAGRRDSTIPADVALQTSQDMGAAFSCLVITNELLASILAALLY